MHGIIYRRDGDENFVVRPEHGGRPVVLRKSDRKPFKIGDHVLYDSISSLQKVDAAEYYRCPDAARRLLAARHRAEPRTLGFECVPVLKRKIPEAFASAGGPKASAAVFYDPLLLGGRLGTRRERAPYSMVVTGKSTNSFQGAVAFLQSVEGEPLSGYTYGIRNGMPPAEMQTAAFGMVISYNGIFGTAYSTRSNPESVLDQVFQGEATAPGKADGHVFVPVEMLVRVHLGQPLIEAGVLKACMEAAGDLAPAGR